MRRRLGDRLPKFSEKDRELMRNKIDFIGLNNYTSRFLADQSNPQTKQIHFFQAQQTEIMGTSSAIDNLSFLFIKKSHHNMKDAGLSIKAPVHKQQTR